MSKLIPLTQGKFAIVDDQDYEELSKYKWYANKIYHTYYAVRSVGSAKKRRTLLMHREILKPPENIEVHHKNHNGLNNCRNNITEATRQQNAASQQKHKTKTTSYYKGVHWDKHGKRLRRWIAEIQAHGIHIVIGCFKNEIEAAKAYDQKAKELFGEFAMTNF